MANLRRTRESLGGGHVKGAMVRAHLQWMREHLSPEVFTRTMASLPKEAATELDGILASSWCSFESLVQLDRAITAATGRNEEELMAELGRYSAEINLSTVYRAFRRTEIHDFFMRGAALHKQFQDFGVSTYEQVDETHGRITIREAATYSPVFCASAPGYYEQVIRLHGGANASAVEKTCVCAGDSACTYELTWR